MSPDVKSQWGDCWRRTYPRIDYPYANHMRWHPHLGGLAATDDLMGREEV